MFLKITEVERGLHPSQVILSIKAEDGQHFISLNKDSVIKSMIDVGNFLGRRGNFYLVELPSETGSGAWRLWVEKSETVETTLEAAE